MTRVAVSSNESDKDETIWADCSYHMVIASGPTQAYNRMYQDVIMDFHCTRPTLN